MKRQEINSSMILSAGYKDGVMEIEFKNGTIYQYDGVDRYVFEDFLASDSKGKYLHRVIKDQYPGKKLEVKEWKKLQES